MNLAFINAKTETVFWLHEDGRWQYLSPLFGEWLDVFDQPNDGQLAKYPRNLGQIIDSTIQF